MKIDRETTQSFIQIYAVLIIGFAAIMSLLYSKNNDIALFSLGALSGILGSDYGKKKIPDEEKPKETNTLG